MQNKYKELVDQVELSGVENEIINIDEFIMDSVIEALLVLQRNKAKRFMIENNIVDTSITRSKL